MQLRVYDNENAHKLYSVFCPAFFKLLLHPFNVKLD